MSNDSFLASHDRLFNSIGDLIGRPIIAAMCSGMIITDGKITRGYCLLVCANHRYHSVKPLKSTMACVSVRS